MDVSEDLSARVLLKHILITETPRTPVTRSGSREQTTGAVRRSSRLSKKDAEARTPQDMLRRSLKQKMRESITRKSLPAPRRRTASVVLRKLSTPSAASVLFNDGETPRHLLMNILQTEPVKSPVVHEKGASEEPEPPLADSTVTGPSVELSGLDLPDVTIGSVANTAKVLSRKRPRRSLNVTAFEKRLKDGDDFEEEIDSSVGDHSSFSLSRSTSLSLKTPFADVRTEKKGLQRRVSNRRKITEEEFGAAVNRREIGGMSSFALVERDLGETTHCEGFTLGLTKLGEPDITDDIVNCNTALYDQPEAMTSNFSIFATQDKPTVMASQLQKEMQERELDEVGQTTLGKHQFMSSFLNEVVVTEPQKYESLSVAQLQEDADEAEPQNVDALCPHAAVAFLSKSEEEKGAAQSHTSNVDNRVESESQTEEEEEGAAESQTEEEEEEGVAESQTEEEEEEGVAESQTEEEEEEGVAESLTEEEEEEGVAESLTEEEEEGVAESLTEEEEEGVAESQTEEEEGAAESQTEEEEGAVESQTEEEEGVAESQTEEEEDLPESQTDQEEETAESQTEVDAVEPQCEDVEAGSQTEEESLLGSQTDKDEERDGGAESHTEEDATDPQSREAVEPGSQSEEDEDVTESQTEDDYNWKGDGKDERQASEQLECDVKRLSQRAHRSEGALMPVAEMGDDLVETTAAGRSGAKSRADGAFDSDASEDMGSHKYSDGAELPMQEQDDGSHVEPNPEAGKESSFHLVGVTQDAEVSGHLGDPPAQDDDEQEEWEDEDDGEESEEFPSKTPAFVREKMNFFQHDHLASPSVIKNIQACGTTEALPAAKPKKVRQRKTRPTKKETVLPKTYLMSVFKHFAKTKVSADVYPVLNETMDKFLERLAEDLEVYAAHAKRKTIEFEDAVLLLKRQGYVNDKVPVEVLIEKYLRMEQRKILIPIATSGNVVIPKRRGKQSYH
ncbi:uncharacterized protein cenpt [Xenentodon cancila]